MVERVAVLGGTGKMGRWFARFFKDKGYEVVIGGRSPERNRAVAEEIGVEAAISNVDAVRGANIVVVSTTLETTVDTIMQIKDSVERGAIVFDIASVKGRIPEALRELSAKGVRAISTHPMFGPGADSFQGRKVIVIPIVEDVALTKWAVDLFKNEGADVHVVSSGEEHDRIIAITLSLTHFLNIVLGRVLARRDIQEVKKFAGTTFSLQLTLVEAVLSEDPNLYYEIESQNPAFRKLLEELLSTAQETTSTLDDKGAFVRAFMEVKERLSKDPQFMTAYERFYRALRASA
jgi:prephenate dehydrogenase